MWGPRSIGEREIGGDYGGGGMESRYRDRNFWRQNTAHVDAYNEYLISCKDKDLNLIPSIKKSKVKYIFEQVLKS